MKLSSNFYVVVTVMMGLGSIVYLFQTQPAIAPAFTALLLPFLVGIVAALQRVETSITASKDNAAALVDVKAVADQNTHQLAAVSEQTSTGLDAVNHKVDGHQQELMEEIRSKNASVDRLTQENAALKQAAALKASTDTQATANKNEIIAATQTAVSDAAALAPPALDATPLGTLIP